MIKGKKYVNISVNELENFPGAQPGASIVPGDTVSIITAESKPDHHGGYLDSGWDCNQWMTYHKRLVEKHGVTKANEIFLTEWNKQSTFDNQYNWCKWTSEFKNYFDSVGIKSPAIVNVAVGAGNVATSLANAAEDTAKDGIGGFGDSLGTVLKWLPWIALGGAMLFVILYFKPFATVAKAAT